MSTPELKMEKFEEIKETVKKLRELEISQHEIGKKQNSNTETLEELGIRCNSVTNCVDVGKFCFKCKNNYARRSYFRDLLQKESDVGIYAMSASMFDSVEKGGEL